MWGTSESRAPCSGMEPTRRKAFAAPRMVSTLHRSSAGSSASSFYCSQGASSQLERSFDAQTARRWDSTPRQIDPKTDHSIPPDASGAGSGADLAPTGWRTNDGAGSGAPNRCHSKRCGGGIVLILEMSEQEVQNIGSYPDGSASHLASIIEPFLPSRGMSMNIAASDGAGRCCHLLINQAVDPAPVADPSIPLLPEKP